jgi:hypothetical protein
LFTDGAYVVGGSFEETAYLEPGIEDGCTLVSAGGRDAWIARYAADGELDWGFRLGANMNDSVLGVAVTADQGVVATGYYTNLIVFGYGGPEEVELFSGGGVNMFLAQYLP